MQQQDLFSVPCEIEHENVQLGSVQDTLSRWLDSKTIRPLDYAFAEFCWQLDPAATEAVLFAALLSRMLADGHICLDFSLSSAQLETLFAEQDERLLIRALLAELDFEHLASAGFVTREPNAHAAPLVLQGSRLYLYRYWNYETEVAQLLSQRLRQPCAVGEGFVQQLNNLFPAGTTNSTDWQKVACAMAATGNFTLITGGPGTGKTTTVVRLLALLQEQAMREQQRPLYVRLAAPTGKAAARLTESISQQIAALPVTEAIRDSIPAQVSTLHRLLGSLPHTRDFKHHRQNPLLLDVLVVDEASMIDLDMMHSLLQALPEHARLILLGDKDQLASVEAGSVLGELCLHAEQGLYTEQTRAQLAALCGTPVSHPQLQPGDVRHTIEQRTVMLRDSRRFAGDSDIGRLAAAVNQMDVRQAQELLQTPSAELAYLQLTSAVAAPLKELIISGYQAYVHILQQERPAKTAELDEYQEWAARMLRTFDEFRLLCAVRAGDFGVQAINRLAETVLRNAFALDEGAWYEGRPVIITRNNYGLGLMNGDIGIAVKVPDGSGDTALRVVFSQAEGESQVRFVLPSRLTEVETVFAMTVHKSQGSEFNHAAVLIPERDNPVLSKELLYTGITRAKHRLSLLEAGRGVFAQAVKTKVSRNSGLRSALAVVSGAGG